MATKQQRLMPHPPAHAHLGKASDKRKRHLAPPSETASTVSFSHTQDSNTTRNLKLENTYRLEPKQGTEFVTSRVHDAVNSVLESYLCDVTYDAVRCPQIARDLSTLIQGRVKELGFPRYKFVCMVSIGQNTGQGIAMVSRALWDTATDNHVSVTYTNKDLYATVTVYALYFE